MLRASYRGNKQMLFPHFHECHCCYDAAVSALFFIGSMANIFFLKNVNVLLTLSPGTPRHFLKTHQIKAEIENSGTMEAMRMAHD